MNEYRVLIRTDGRGCITAIDSDGFVADENNWTQIDQGNGDRYYHAQGNYLPGPLMDERGIPRYKLSGGRVVERTQAEIDADWLEPEEERTNKQRIEDLEEALEMILSGVTA